VAYYSKLVQMAKKQGKKVILVGQGIGPPTGSIGKSLARKAFNMADMISVRDPQSVQTLKDLGVKLTPRQGADMAFLLPKPSNGEENKQFGVGNMKTVGLSARPWGKDKNKAVVELFSELSRLLFSKGYMAVMLEMDSVQDKALIEAVSKANGGKVPEIRNIHSPVAMQQRMARMDAVIAMRLHAGILAATVDVVPFMVSYDPKVTALTNVLGLPAAPSVEGLKAGRLFDLFIEAQRTRERNAAALPAKIQQLAAQAQSSVDAMLDVLG
jgi:polysaccharide pyruvyl transferase WcaK-like protein